MTDYIDRQAAIRWVKTECNPYGKPTIDYESGVKVIDHIETMPSAEVEPVKHGRWEPGKEISRTMLCNETIAIDYEDWHCSVCGRRYKEYVLPYRYCPHCGAKMDLGGEAHEQN